MRFKTIFLLSVIMHPALPQNTVAQIDTTGGGFMDLALAPARLLAAKHEFNENNMRGALTIYREILDAYPDHANALYGTAKCHYNLKKYKLALEYLDKAVNSDPDVDRDKDFFYGQIHHRLANLDKAIGYFDSYCKSVSESSGNFETAREYIHQCQFAKEMMAQPVNVKIENMTDAINSRYDDYAPSITADGKLLVFTSRRSDTKGGRIDESGDYKFFEDIYYSELDAATGTWSNSTGLNGDVNTETYDAVLSIAPNGNEIFIYKNTSTTAGDIFFSKYSAVEDKWLAPEKLPRPVNTSYYEGSVSMTADGQTLYFISEREAGMGMGDIYVSEKRGDDWSSPKNIGALVNTDYDEKFVFIHPNGKTLYFSSNGHATMGSYDIFKTEFVNGQWSIPVNLGYPVNTVNEESTFSLTRDNKTLYIAAEYDDSHGERDIYRIDVSGYDLLSGSYDVSSFGSINCVATTTDGKPLKGAHVNFFSATSDKLITQGKTDKNGMLKVNLPVNLSYRIEIKHGDKTETRELTLKSQKTAPFEELKVVF